MDSSAYLYKLLLVLKSSDARTTSDMVGGRSGADLLIYAMDRQRDSQHSPNRHRLWTDIIPMLMLGQSFGTLSLYVGLWLAVAVVHGWG